MADKQRVAQGGGGLLDTSFGAQGPIDGSDVSNAASAWEAALADDSGEERTDELDGGKGPKKADTDGQGRNRGPDDDEESEEASEEEFEEEDDSEDEDEDEDDDSEDEEESEAQEIDPETKVKVKIDGQEQEVTLAELQQGYSRTQDYTQKTQKLAEERRSLEAEQSKILEQQQQWSTALGQLSQRLQAGLSGRTEQEWAALKQQDEIAYYEERENERAIEKRLDAIKTEQERVQQEQNQHLQRQMKEFAQQQGQELLSKVPEWADTEAYQRDRAKIEAYGKSIGFEPQEINSIMDHRAILVLRDAARYRDMVEARNKGNKPKKTRTRTLSPGAPTQDSGRGTKAKKARQRHNKERSVDSAAAVFENLLGDNR